MRVLLQQDIQFFAQPDPAQTTITLIVFAALIVFGIVIAFINSHSGKSGGGGTGSLNRLAKRMGLSPDQRAALKELARGQRLQNPQRLLTNPAYLNHALKRRLDQIDRLDEPEPAREARKALLLSAKRTIQNASTNLKVLSSTRHIRVGQAVRITDADGASNDVLVASNVHNGLGVEVPRARRSSTSMHAKGAQLTVDVVMDNAQLYTFKTRVIGYNNARGASVMFIEHASNVRQTQKRRSPRREYDSPCYFFPVTVITVGKGRRAKTQAFVSKNQRFFGRFEDLSAGGCAVRTQSPLATGSILKIDFEGIDGARTSVFGMVRHVERQRARGRLMHIKFTRVSRKHLNQIQTYVYGIAES